MNAGASEAFRVWRRPPKASPQTTLTSAGELCVREMCRRHTTGGKETVHEKKETQNRDPDTTVWHLRPTFADSAAE